MDRQKVGYCLDRRVPIFPLKHADNPHGFLGRFQAEDCAELNDERVAGRRSAT